MSRKSGLILSFAAIILITAYMGYEASNIAENITSFNEFLSAYLDKNQKYLFNISIYVIPIMYFFKEPFLKPEYRIRLNGNLIDYLSKKYIIISLVLSAYILMTYFVVGIFMGYDIYFNRAYIMIFIKLFSFIFYCFILYTVIYFWSGKEIFGILGVFAVNLLLLIFLSNYNFYKYTNTLNDDLLTFIFIIYMAAINIIGFLYLYLNIEKRECLK